MEYVRDLEDVRDLKCMVALKAAGGGWKKRAVAASGRRQSVGEGTGRGRGRGRCFAIAVCRFDTN